MIDAKIIDSTPKAKSDFQKEALGQFGGDTLTITREMLDALKSGKSLAVDDGEVTLFIDLSPDKTE